MNRRLLLAQLTLQAAAARLLYLPIVTPDCYLPLGPLGVALRASPAGLVSTPTSEAPPPPPPLDGPLAGIKLPAGLASATSSEVPAPPLNGPLAGIKRLAYVVLHKTVARGEVVYPRVAVFMIGLPGSGKSRVIQSRYQLRRSQANSTQVLDLDAEIEQHPEWDDNDPDRVYLDPSLDAYRWADARVEARFHAAVHDHSVLRLVLDGTGTNLERQVRRMREAAAAGMFVKAIYVRVPCQTAITRASMRRRPVTAERIRYYYSKMSSALTTARRHAHEVTRAPSTPNLLLAAPHTTPRTCARAWRTHPMHAYHTRTPFGSHGMAANHPPPPPASIPPIPSYRLP